MVLRGAAVFVSLVLFGTQAQAAYEKELGPLANTVSTQLLKGWNVKQQDGWVLLQNFTATESEQSLSVHAGQAPETGRIISAALGVYSEKPNASVGITLGNRAQKSICLLEISANKTVNLFCTEGEKRHNIASIPNLAKLDGSDTVKIIEVPGAARFLLNDQKIGEISDIPALGAEIGVMAYDIGTFAITGFNIDSNLNTQLPPRSETGGTAPASGSGSGSGIDASTSGEGPLPEFGNDTVRLISVYMGLVQSILMHEFGHALIGELQLPSTGPEEDAVDVYAALQVVQPTMYPDPNKEVNDIANGAATYAALQWYYSGKLSEMKGADTSPWQDEHTADLKRFRNMFCIMYGGNPNVFEPVAQSVGLEERTKARCGDEFNKQNRAWRRILAPHTRVGTWNPDGEVPAGTPGAPITAIFEPSQRRVGNLLANHLSGGLKGYIQRLGETYVMPRPVQVTFKDCGQLNAWYSPREGTVTMCYDLIEHLAVMISDIEMKTVGGHVSAPESGTTPVSTTGGGSGSTGADTSSAPTSASVAKRFDELEDLGVPQTFVLFPAPYNGPTPNYIKKAKIIKTVDLVDMLKTEKNILLIDTGGLRETLPEAYSLVDAGTDGSTTDRFQSALNEWLMDKTKGQRDVKLVFFGQSMQERTSFNAALRAGTLGWPTYWYRGGLEAWLANGLPTVTLK